MAKKVFVKVLAEHDTDGAVYPLSFVWEDERTYAIDRILNVCRAASLKAGGIGMRYTCVVRGRQTHLFHEGDRWFMESRGE